MTKVSAFDSKEYNRSNAAGEVKFYTPLGCGITVSKEEEFDVLYAEKLLEIANSFKIGKCCGGFSPAEYIKKIGPAKTVSLSDQLLKSVQGLIESVYFSYVILPPKETPTVEVGGYKSPKKEMPTFEFLRKLSVYFSYVTAWKYLGIEGRQSEKILIDGFHGKRTPAWDDIVAKTSPITYPHGDECNPFISTADILSFLTNKKLWDNYLHLTPENITQVWNGYSFSTDTHFLDKNILSKVKWYSDEHIELSSYYARPVIFLKADGYKIDQLKELDVYPEATILARQRKGCLQGFDKDVDSSKIKDGDVFVYAGEESMKTANTLKDIYKIEILPFKELKEKI
jgi:hypothetical protein